MLLNYVDEHDSTRGSGDARPLRYSQPPCPGATPGNPWFAARLPGKRPSGLSEADGGCNTYTAWMAVSGVSTQDGRACVRLLGAIAHDP